MGIRNLSLVDDSDLRGLIFILSSLGVSSGVRHQEDLVMLELPELKKDLSYPSNRTGKAHFCFSVVPDLASQARDVYESIQALEN